MIVLAAFVLGLFIFLSTGVLVYNLRKIDDSREMYHAAMNTLVDLVNKLNEELPDCNLGIETSNKSINIVGNIKYYKKQ